MTRVGIVGLGFMGMVHFLTYQKLPGVKVVAICDRSAKKLSGDWTSIRGNFGPPGSQVDLSGVATYQSIDELVADPNVDLVDITLPPAMHCEIAIRALTAGKDVFCEKPMALNVADCDRMIAAAEKSQRRLLIGHVLPFFPEFAWALREIESGKHGRVLNGSFKRVIADPAWLTRYWDSEIGGPLLDLHVHDAHFIRMVFGMPSRVTTNGSMRNGLAEHWHTLFEFAEPQTFAHVSCGAPPFAGRPFCHGFEIRLERATLMFEFAVRVLENGETVAGYTMPPTILTHAGTAEEVSLGDGDPMNAFHEELSSVLEVLRDQKANNALSCALARDAIEICELEAASLASHLA